MIQAEDGIRDGHVTGVQTCALPISKVFWLSGVLGGGQPVWVLDPRDAQYLNTTVEELRKNAEALAGEGVVRLAADTEFATPTEALRSEERRVGKECRSRARTDDSSRRRHTRWPRDWSSDVCSSDLEGVLVVGSAGRRPAGVGAGPAGCAVSEYDGGGTEEERGGACGRGRGAAGGGYGVCDADRGAEIGRASCRERV